MPNERELCIAVADDTEQDRKQIMELTAAVLNEAGIRYRMDAFMDSDALLNAIRKGRKYHLLLLDVLMGEMDGIALAAALRKDGNNAAIIFISANPELAHRGYRVDASRYLVKPLDREELTEGLMYCYGKWQAKKEILLSTDQGQCRIPFADIQFVEAYDRGTRFVLLNETVETKLKFGEAEALLPKSVFLLCHRAYIVNLGQTRQIKPYEFRMKSGIVVPISRYRYNEVNRKFVDYVTD